MHIPRGWTNADAVAATREFLSQPPPRRAAIRDLMRVLLAPDAYNRRCAADLARRISGREPGILRAYAPVLIDLLAELPEEQWQARGYVTLAAALNASTQAERNCLSVYLHALVEDSRNALRAIALEALAILAAGRNRSCALRYCPCWNARAAKALAPCAPAPGECSRRCWVLLAIKIQALD